MNCFVAEGAVWSFDPESKELARESQGLVPSAWQSFRKDAAGKWEVVVNYWETVELRDGDTGELYGRPAEEPIWKPVALRKTKRMLDRVMKRAQHPTAREVGDDAFGNALDDLVAQEHAYVNSFRHAVRMYFHERWYAIRVWFWERQRKAA